MRIYILYPNYFVNRAVTHTCLSLAKSLHDTGIYEIYLMGMGSDLANKPFYYHDAIPLLLQRLAFKFFNRNQLTAWTEFRFTSGLKKNDIVYLWPNTSLSVFKKAKRKGCKIIIENINCHQSTRKNILANEFKRLNLPFTHQVSQNNIDTETDMMALTDIVFSPSPEVSKSLITANVPEYKIITSSYGLTETEVLPISFPKPSTDKIVFLFVVRKLEVRKGIHLLLNYWSKANINGTLKIVGTFDPLISDIIEPHTQNKSIEFIPFQESPSKLTSIFKQSDVFIFPSLEEGSPLVTYAALGAGLPSIVSPMGGGGVIRHKTDGYIIPPHDENSWVEAIRKITNNTKLRNKMALSAWQHSHEFLWAKVGQKRSNLLIEKLKL